MINRCVITLVLMGFLGHMQMTAQITTSDSSVSPSDSAKSWLPGVDFNLAVVGSIGFGASNDGWSACAGLKGMYFFPHEVDEKSFLSAGFGLHYGYTNGGSGGDLYGSNISRFNLGPCIALNQVIHPRVIVFGQLQPMWGRATNKTVEPFSQEEFGDNINQLGVRLSTGFFWTIPQRHAMLSLETDVLSVMRNKRSPLGFPDQSTSSTDWWLGLNKANVVTVSYVMAIGENERKN
ncbi:MAG: hypothetical protein AAF206_31270 [Bacteroidota bacterium]